MIRLDTALKLMAKKYPSTNQHPLGAILVLYDDGSGFIRKTWTGNNDFHCEHLYGFDNLDRLIAHLKGDSK